MRWGWRGGTLARYVGVTSAPRTTSAAKHRCPLPARVTDLVLLLSTHGGHEWEPARVVEFWESREKQVAGLWFARDGTRSLRKLYTNHTRVEKNMYESPP